MDDDLPLLNIFDVESPEGTRHFVGLQDAVMAGAVGLSSRAMVGEFTPDPSGDFDLSTFVPNLEFSEAVAEYLDTCAREAPALVAAAEAAPGRPLYLVDPRSPTPDDQDPPAEDVLGHFEVDESGRIVAESFTYNRAHAWFSPRSGVSGLLSDRQFYNWLHPEFAPRERS